jgi:protocatechuate 3,4-dioxygenase beta subunit
MNKKKWISYVLFLICVIAGGYVLTALAQEPPRQIARISGRVLGADGKALANAMVEAVGGGTAYTDSGGNYSIEVNPGTYRVRAQRNGYVSAVYKLDETNSDGTPLSVEAGQHLTSINCRLAKGGVITGRVLDENGDPVIGEAVSVKPKDRGRPAGLRPSSTLLQFNTDDRGIYRIYGLPSGSYYVSVTVKQRKIGVRTGGRAQTSQQQTTYYPGVTWLDEATEVTVAEGVETTSIDFKIKAESEKASIFGSVTGMGTGKPMAGVFISARSLDRPQISATARSGEEGYYEMKNLPSGRYVVRAQAFVREGPDSEIDLAPPDPQEVMVGSASVELNFEFVRGGQISGRVLLEDGRVPKDVTKLTLTLRPSDPREFSWMQSPIPRPNSEGAFTIKGIPVGRYRLLVQGGENYYLKSVVFDDAEVKERGIVVERASQIRDVQVVLSDAGAVVRGRVMGDKAPLPDAVVSLFSVDVLSGQPSGMQSQLGGRTDQRGEFNITAIRPGRYYIFAYMGSPPWLGKMSLPEFLGTNQARIQSVDLKANETKVVNLTAVGGDQK